MAERRNKLTPKEIVKQLRARFSEQPELTKPMKGRGSLSLGVPGARVDQGNGTIRFNGFIVGMRHR